MNMFSKGLLVLCLLFSVSLMATQIDEFLQIPMTDTAPEIDGEMDDVWKTAGKERMDEFNIESGLPDDWFDQWTVFYVMWDETNMYYYAEVMDDLLDVSSANSYENDGFELMLDGDNSKNDATTNYTDGNDSQWRFVLNETVGETGNGNTVPASAVVAWTETDFGYTFECALPLAEFEGWLPEADLEIGFEVQVNDCDDGARQHINRWFNESNETWHDPSYMGNAVFRGEDWHVASEFLRIDKASGAPVIDGEMEAWWTGIANIGNTTYIPGETNYDELLDQYDFDFECYQAWNEDGFYLFLNTIDDVLSVSAANTYEKDNLEIYFDGDNSKNDATTNYTDGNDAQWRATLYETTLETGNGVEAPTDVEMAWAETDFGAALEMFIPAGSLPFVPEADAEIGYELQLSDDDDASARLAIARWYSDSNETWHDPSYMGNAILSPTVVAATEDAPIAVPSEFELGQNYPNPFNPTTSIDYNVASRGYVKLAVYDLLGKEVATLVNGVQPAGKNTVTFSASRLTSGVYFYKLEADNKVITKKMTLLK